MLQQMLDIAIPESNASTPTGETLKAPFPYFGGKSRIAQTVWEQLGTVKNYIDPFFGSGAVLLARPDWQVNTIELYNKTPRRWLPMHPTRHPNWICTLVTGG